MTIKNLELKDPQRQLAYSYTPPKGDQLTVAFLCGLMSDMEGTKSIHLEEWCAHKGLGFLRFDYQGHGQSSGEFVDGSISLWQEDTLAMIDQVTQGPLILVGSSMGGWQMLLAALNRPDRVKGLVGIAPAPDFTQELMEPQFNESVHETLNNGDVYEVPSDYGPSGYPITKRFLDDGDKNRLLGSDIKIDIPVHLLHGIQDVDVPYDTSLRIMNHVTSGQVKVTLLKDGDHRLSREQDLHLLETAIEGVINDIQRPKDIAAAS